MRDLKIFGTSLVVAFCMMACGGDNSSNSTVTGQFVDDVVQGMSYSCGTSEDSTNSQGRFTCRSGTDVTFYLGDIPIATVAAQNGTTTPYTLFPNDTQAVINLARLLQSLDGDGNPDNGVIVLDLDLIALLPLSIDFSSQSFEVDIEAALGIQLVSEEAALEALNNTIISLGGSIPVGGHFPVADAGPDQNTSTGATVTLDGSGSSDADGDSLTYSWTLTLPGDSSAELSSTTAVNPTFTVDTEGVYIVELTVNDGILESAVDTVTITAETASSNTPPVADAGPDQNVKVGVTVALDGSDSSDVDAGDTLTYAWNVKTVAGGSSITNASLSSTTAAQPTFTPDVAGTYIIGLVVNDGAIDSAVDTVTITATAVASNTPPVADAGEAQNVSTADTVQLDGSGSQDADNDDLTYSWSIITKPDTTSGATLSDSAAINPTFVADLDGEYVVQLIVNDGTVDSVATTVLITAETTNSTPVADAGDAQSVTTGELVTLDGSGSSDADLDDLSYTWSFISVVDGSSITNSDLSDPEAENPTFTPDVDGPYIAQLIVNDGSENSTPDTVTITATAASSGGSGSLDPDFDGDGIAVYDPGTGADHAYGITHDASDNVYVTGYINNGRDNDMVLMKYTSSGALDTTFGNGDGIVVYDSGISDVGYDLILDGGGNILVTGYIHNGIDADMAIWKFDSSGEPVTLFGINGVAIYDGGNVDVGHAITLDTSGRILVTGSSKTGPNLEDTAIAVWQYSNSTGSPISVFGGGDGIFTYNVGDNTENGKSITVDADNNIMVAGSYIKPRTSSFNSIVFKLDITGSGLVQTFGQLGEIKELFGQSANDIVIDDQGNYLVMGYGGFPVSLKIWKYNGNGALVTDFGVNGIVSYACGATTCGRAIALDSASNIFVVGQIPYNMTLWKYDSNGQSVASFGDNGVITYAGELESGGESLTIDSADNILIGGYSFVPQGSTGIVVWKYE